VEAQRYTRIVEHYEQKLSEHGPTYKGVDWPRAEDVDVRNAVMLDVCRDAGARASLLDLGCGIGLLPDFLRARGLLEHFDYLGIDLSARMVTAAKARHPDLRFEVRDVLKNPLGDGVFDYVIMNGLLTVKASLAQGEMEEFASSMIEAAFRAARRGLAFNVMSEHVDWKREDLFHWPFDRAAAFLKRACSRHVVFRADYGLYEYTAYVFRESNRRTA
jgi:SAM-dependent methyltransferase